MAKIIDSNSASEIYQDAISSGNTAVLGSAKEDNQQITINIGKMAPGDSIKVQVCLSFALQADENKWKLELPQAFFPINSENISFNVMVGLSSSEPIVEY